MAKHKVGQRVRYKKNTGIIREVWTKDPDMPKYTVDFGFGSMVLRENQVEKA
jgi:hypothetical protein